MAQRRSARSSALRSARCRTYSRSAPAVPSRERREPTPRTRLPGPGGCRRRCGREQQQCRRAAGSRHGDSALPLSGAHTRPAAAEGKCGRGIFRNRPFPEHPWLSRRNRMHAGRGRGWNLCQLGMLVFVPEISRRRSHVTWCVLAQQGRQYALFGVNPHLPARSPHKIIARRSDTGDRKSVV